MEKPQFQSDFVLVAKLNGSDVNFENGEDKSSDRKAKVYSRDVKELSELDGVSVKQDDLQGPNSGENGRECHALHLLDEMTQSKGLCSVGSIVAALTSIRDKGGGLAYYQPLEDAVGVKYAEEDDGFEKSGKDVKHFFVEGQLELKGQKCQIFTGIYENKEDPQNKTKLADLKVIDCGNGPSVGKAEQLEDCNAVSEMGISTQFIPRNDILKFVFRAEVLIDETVITGQSHVNGSMITREARAISEELGDRVIGGTRSDRCLQADEENVGLIQPRVSKGGDQTENGVYSSSRYVCEGKEIYETPEIYQVVNVLQTKNAKLESTQSVFEFVEFGVCDESLGFIGRDAISLAPPMLEEEDQSEHVPENLSEVVDQENEWLSFWEFGTELVNMFIPWNLILLVPTKSCAQALEPAILISLQLSKLFGTKCIMVGDPKQLPAIVLTNVSSKFLSECSLFECVQMVGQLVILLTKHYKVHPYGGMFPSIHFFEKKLIKGYDMPSKAATLHENSITKLVEVPEKWFLGAVIMKIGCTVELELLANYLERHMQLDEKCLEYVLSIQLLGFEFSCQNFPQLFLPSISMFVNRETLASLELLQHEYDIDLVDVEDVSTIAIIHLHLNEGAKKYQKLIMMKRSAYEFEKMCSRGIDSNFFNREGLEKSNFPLEDMMLLLYFDWMITKFINGMSSNQLDKSVKPPMFSYLGDLALIMILYSKWIGLTSVIYMEGLALSLLKAVGPHSYYNSDADYFMRGFEWRSCRSAAFDSNVKLEVKF
ncbi:hypothetical protein ACLB2K_001258 [Fragaria x ananassa]